jgi:hypothetical protein
MLATAQNIDVMCLQLMNNYSQLDKALQNKLDDFVANVKKILTSADRIKPTLNKVLPQIFDLRFLAIKWLISNGNFNLTNLLEEIYPQIEILKTDKKLEILADNVLFALRCNQKVATALLTADEDLSQDSIEREFSKQAPITYEQFVSSLYHIPGEAMQVVLDWAHASLYIEFVILAAVISSDSNLEISDNVIDEMSFIVSDAAQEYTAAAVLLGILPRPRRRNDEYAHTQFDKEFIEEQKDLADLGIFDYASEL